MKLTEEKYQPNQLDDIITPNKAELLEKIRECIRDDTMNLLFVGSPSTYRSRAMLLVLKEYYGDNDGRYYMSLDCFSDVNPSVIKTFCQTNISKRKCIFINNFDSMNESIQPLIKTMMDTYKNVFFMFGCDSGETINECIKSRMTPLYFEPMTRNEHRVLITLISEGEGIVLRNIDALLDCSHLSIYYIYNLFNKFLLKGIVEVDDISSFLFLIDRTILKEYFFMVETGDIKKASLHIMKLHENGYSLLDIYHFLYEYLKTETGPIHYIYIEKLCYFIQYIYEGHDNKVMLLIMTNELFLSYKNRIDLYGSKKSDNQRTA